MQLACCNLGAGARALLLRGKHGGPRYTVGDISQFSRKNARDLVHHTREEVREPSQYVDAT
jgi:hypothetical protein